MSLSFIYEAVRLMLQARRLPQASEEARRHKGEKDGLQIQLECGERLRCGVLRRPGRAQELEGAFGRNYAGRDDLLYLGQFVRARTVVPFICRRLRRREKRVRERLEVRQNVRSDRAAARDVEFVLKDMHMSKGTAAGQ